MAETSSIEWTDATWNPIAGCSLKSPGCTNCYAMPTALRHELMSAASGRVSPYAGLTRKVNGKAVWTGEMRLVEAALTLPLRWRKPRRIFVNSMSDLFHEDVPDAWIDRVFAIMALAPQHTFQVLTKRAARMRAYLSAARAHPVGLAAMEQTLISVAANPRSEVGAGIMLQGDIVHLKVWPLPNVWLGVSAEDQRRADERVPDLLATPAAVRFVSAEPLLGPITFSDWWLAKPKQCESCDGDGLGGRSLRWCPNGACPHDGDVPRLDWIIVGGESGPGARPMHPAWARQIRDACTEAGVAYLFKQWGSWAPEARGGEWMILDSGGGLDLPDHRWPDEEAGEVAVTRTGKKAAGRLLDGVTHDGFPELRP